MEKRAIEKRSGKDWVNINMSELVQGDEFRYADETERTYVVEGAPWVNDKGVWTVEVQDE